MPVKMLEKAGVVYIACHRTGANDFAAFRKAIVRALKGAFATREIIVDLTQNETISSAEKTLLLNAANALAGSKRILHIIVSPGIKPDLAASASGNLVMYDSHKAMLASLNAVRETGAPPD